MGRPCSNSPSDEQCIQMRGALLFASALWIIVKIFFRPSTQSFALWLNNETIRAAKG